MTRWVRLFVPAYKATRIIAEIFVEGQENVAFKAPEPVDGGLFMQAVPADRLDFEPAGSNSSRPARIRARWPAKSTKIPPSNLYLPY